MIAVVAKPRIVRPLDSRCCYLVSLKGREIPEDVHLSYIALNERGAMVDERRAFVYHCAVRGQVGVTNADQILSGAQGQEWGTFYRSSMIFVRPLPSNSQSSTAIHGPGEHIVMSRDHT